jgi:hypothetical protein
VSLYMCVFATRDRLGLLFKKKKMKVVSSSLVLQNMRNFLSTSSCVYIVSLSYFSFCISTFVYDPDKATRAKEALERKKREEGKRKAYEERMVSHMRCELLCCHMLLRTCNVATFLHTALFT